MKRRNVDCGKIRRPVKRNKITEGIYGSTLLYLKFLLLWVLVILADFLLEFRFEFLWPFWLLLRSVYDSYKYQGLAFSVFFVCIALTSDMVCFFFIPVHWLFFAASTYVWVQYVWHTDKGICVPTIILWMLFVYLEAAVRLKDLRHLPFHLDLCRPFAAHCIGYPVVTLGFGFKSYVGYRIRQRKQKDVAKENEFYIQLLQQALPIEQNTQQSATTQTETVAAQPPVIGPKVIRHGLQNSADKWRTSDTLTSTSHHNGSVISNGNVSTNGTIPNNTKNNHRKSVDKVNEAANSINHRHNNLESNHTISLASSMTNDKHNDKKYIHTNGISDEHHYNHTDNSNTTLVEDSVEDTNKFESETSNKVKSPTVFYTNKKYEKRDNVTPNVQNNRKNKTQQQQQQQHHHHQQQPAKDVSSSSSDKEASEYVQKLESDLKRLRSDLQTSRSTEQELRVQIASLSSSEKAIRVELTQLQRDNEELQNKIQNISEQRQAERQALERRVGEERRARAAVEAQLAHERRSQQRRHEEQQAQQHKNECTEQCKSRRRELECEARDLRSALRTSEERLTSVEREFNALQQQHHDTDILMSALSAMQDKNQHLEDSLSAETRIKLDLFSALGEAKRQVEIKDSMIRSQDKEISELKTKIAQVLAVMPNDSFSSPTPGLVSSRIRLGDNSCQTPHGQISPAPTSQLDPNATAYTPKSSLVGGTEA